MQGSAELINKIVCQAAAILILSFGLGLAFNASNPIGIAWSGTTPRTEPTPARPTLASLSASPNPVPPAPAPLASPTNQAAPPPAPVASASGPRPDAYSVATVRPNDQQSQVIWSSPPGSTTNATPATTTATNAPAAPALPIRYSTATTWALTKPLVADGKAVLIDARPKAIYDAGHIPGAMSLPEGSPPEEFAALQKKFKSDEHLVVYCASTSCSVSKRVADKITQEYGFTNVSFMTGGYQEWQQAELAQNKTNAHDQAVKP